MSVRTWFPLVVAAAVPAYAFVVCMLSGSALDNGVCFLFALPAFAVLLLSEKYLELLDLLHVPSEVQVLLLVALCTLIAWAIAKMLTLLGRN